MFNCLIFYLYPSPPDAYYEVDWALMLMDVFTPLVQVSFLAPISFLGGQRSSQ